MYLLEFIMKRERRCQRSDNPIEAATLYLTAAAERRQFTALTLTNEDGGVIAEAPTPLDSTSLASVAPFARTDAPEEGGLLRLVTRGQEFRVWDVQIAGERHYLAAVGTDALACAETVNSLERILG